MTGFAEYDNYDGLGLAELVRSGEVCAGDLLEEAIARNERVNGELNAVVHTFYDQARVAIEAGLPEGPFQGVPFLLKDLHLAMRGTTTSNGSGMWRDQIADHDSTLVQRYRQAGLVTFGKTNSPELGLMPVTEPKAFGPSRNPWDTDKTPGGSSGGSGAAVAAGIVPMAHASDGGGSIRIPAACCGLVGLKPSRGRVPFGPDKAEGWAGQSTSHVVSRSVRDTAAILDATAGPEVGEAYAAPYYGGSFLKAAQSAPAALKIAVSRQKWGKGAYQSDALAGIDASVALLEDLGHQVEEARPDYDGEALASLMFTIVSVNTALAARQRAGELGCSVDDLEMEDSTRFTMELGNSISAADYAEAIQMNQRAGRLLGEFHQKYDILLAPTLSSAPVSVGYISDAPPQEYGDRLVGFMGDTGLYNQTGQPSISLPLHWTDNNLPLGMMFTAAFGNDALLLQLAGQLEQSCPWWERRPPLHSRSDA
ncbi:MAG: amidase [Halieaceae bacterium]|jgi:amidase|nr:amidase [Halieaceae bacterium]